MIEFTIKNCGNSYNITFLKEVHKRNGEIVNEPGDTLYNISLDSIKNIITHESTIKDFKDLDISLSNYLKKFNSNYIKVCELLKKTL